MEATAFTPEEVDGFNAAVEWEERADYAADEAEEEAMLLDEDGEECWEQELAYDMACGYVVVGGEVHA